MPIQLRLYTINRGALHDFAAEWTARVKPLREQLGFQVLGAWTLASTNQFLWLLRYDGPEGWEAKDRAYYDSAERRSMQPDPARHIARIEHVFIDPVG